MNLSKLAYISGLLRDSASLLLLYFFSSHALFDGVLHLAAGTLTQFSVDTRLAVVFSTTPNVGLLLFFFFFPGREAVHYAY